LHGHHSQVVHLDVRLNARSPGPPLAQETPQVAFATVRERAQHAHRHSIRSDRAYDVVNALGERGHEIGQLVGVADSYVQRRRAGGEDTAVGSA
jgi:hypothetical protein